LTYRTANLQSCISYIHSTNIGTEHFKQGVYSLFFSLQNAVCFIILTCLVPVLFTFYIQGVLKLKKNNSGAKRLISIWYYSYMHMCVSHVAFFLELFRSKCSYGFSAWSMSLDIYFHSSNDHDSFRRRGFKICFYNLNCDARVHTIHNCDARVQRVHNCNARVHTIHNISNLIKAFKERVWKIEAFKFASKTSNLCGFCRC